MYTHIGNLEYEKNDTQTHCLVCELIFLGLFDKPVEYLQTAQKCH